MNNNSTISYGQITMGLLVSVIAVGVSYYFSLMLLFWVSIFVIIFYVAILFNGLTSSHKQQRETEKYAESKSPSAEASGS